MKKKHPNRLRQVWWWLCGDPWDPNDRLLVHIYRMVRTAQKNENLGMHWTTAKTREIMRKYGVGVTDSLANVVKILYANPQITEKQFRQLVRGETPKEFQNAT